MNNEYFVYKGYKRYDPTPFDNSSIVDRFQKRFDDDFGKKYFIDVIKWDNSFVPEYARGDYWKRYTYVYEVQVSFGEKEKALNLEWFSDWTLEEVEEFMEKFFEIAKPNY